MSQSVEASGHRVFCAAEVLREKMKYFIKDFSGSCKICSADSGIEGTEIKLSRNPTERKADSVIGVAQRLYDMHCYESNVSLKWLSCCLNNNAIGPIVVNSIAKRAGEV